MRQFIRWQLLFFLLILGSTQAFAQMERITNYEVAIEVAADRSVMVTEEITVDAAGQDIRRGITRSLPKSRDLQGRTRNMVYEIEKVERDGKEEAYHSKSQGNKKVLYIGQKDVILSPGSYTYTIQYRVPNQVGFFEDYDEIYWNAIGHDVIFPIERASCTVTVPPGTKVIQAACYTGAYGSRASDCTFEENSDQTQVSFQTNSSLRPYEGFTVGVGFDKGVVQTPGFLERFSGVLLLGVGAIGLFFYLIRTWRKHGVDPPKPTPYPLFESPEGLSPAALNYIAKEQMDSKSITASVIHLAVQGYLFVEEEEKKGWFTSTKIYKLKQLKTDYSGLSREERALMEGFFKSSDTAVIDGEYDSQIKKTYSAHKAAVMVEHKDFVNKGRNLKFLVVPIILTVAFAGLGMLLISRSMDGFSGLNAAVFIIFIVSALIGIFTFAYLINRPSKEKLKLQSEIEGFKMYLQMAEEDRINLLNPPDRTPEHFEAMLPFAFALGIEHIWSKLFKGILEKSLYEPKWTNNSQMYMTHHFSNSFGDTMKATSTQPSSSGGGSGGGGFSGGGGGGGGVGGW